MATADEILSKLASEDDKLLIIDNDLRKISIPRSVEMLGVESDEDVLRLRFRMPRMCGDTDLSDFVIRINYVNAKGIGDIYTVSDTSIVDDTITFSWLISRNATAYKGSVRFIVCLKLYDETGLLIKEYNTTVSSLPVLEGLEVSDIIIEQNPDIIEKILLRLDKLENSGEIDPEAVQQIVEDYLAANPPTVTETDPTVPAWAKAENKPEYTAEEVGALPADALPGAVYQALAQAKASGEFDGADGKDGADGVGIQFVDQTVTSTEDGGTNVITVTKTDGTSSTFAVKNGSKGSTGATGAAGQDGHSPVVTATKSGKTTTISVDGADIATVEDGTDGAPGKDGADGSNGKDGITPSIGDNGNWYLGATDTGKPSRGEKGDTGDIGPVGPQGEKGEKGDTGDIGPVGPQGEIGPQGPKGDPGDPGPAGADGAPGKDGTSATHSWNGTVLTITSSSGTSSADLKGEKGDKGDTGAKGDKGEQGLRGLQGEQGIQGIQGEKGDKGDKGADGKSAYQYAVDGGYTGTETEFAAKMAAEIPTVDATLTQSGQAADAAVVGDQIRSLSEEMLTEESDPTVPAWAKAATKPGYTATEVGADPSGTAVSKVSAHNTGADSHNDIRLLIRGLTDRLNALADSDDTTLDQMSEVVAYIKSNKSLIDSVTTSKVSVADIIDNLTTNVSNKPLSAAQGVALKALIDAITDAVESIKQQTALVPTTVESVEEMTDTTKEYILASTGTIWSYQETTTTGEITVQAEGEFAENSRLGSDGSALTGYSGYVTSPFIDLLAYPVPFTLHLDGGTFIPSASETYTRMCTYTEAQAKINCGNTVLTLVDSFLNVSDSDVSVDSDGNASILFDDTPKTNNANNDGVLKYVRFSGKGSVSTVSAYVTYEGEVTTNGWVDTGVKYSSGSSVAITQMALDKMKSLNNEGTDPETITLLPQPVLEFYNSDDYPDDDYTITHLSKITYPCRADIPVPYTVKWSHNEDAMRTTVAVDKKAIGTVNAYTMRTYDATGFDNYPIFNLLPSTTYFYKVTHVLSDGSLLEAKSGSFTTSNETWRLLYIDGTQNVRDLGGWTGLDGKKVKYGKIIRGAALNDSSLPELLLTGKGRRSLGELAIQAELNLGATDTETSIASNCVYKKIGYTNYAIAFTGEAYRSQFKEVLEWIVDCLTASKPVYMHCQGGCDRTGTLSFQLLGLLGVSESDLAKEYELSSFSSIGLGRLRTTTKAVDTYDYVGMVEALKAYSGATVADKFYDFATTGCGISEDTITNFRNLMLE